MGGDELAVLKDNEGVCLSIGECRGDNTVFGYNSILVDRLGEGVNYVLALGNACAEYYSLALTVYTAHLGKRASNGEGKGGVVVQRLAGEADGVVRKSNVAYSSVTDDLTADKGYGGGGKVEDGVLRCYAVKLYVAVAQGKREFGIVVSLERAAK